MSLTCGINNNDNLKMLLHTCDTYNHHDNCDYLPHTVFHFYLIDFQLNTDFPFQFCVFTVKSPSVTRRSVSKENAFKKSKHPSPFLRKTIGLNNSFTLIENNFRSLGSRSLNSR